MKFRYLVCPLLVQGAPGINFDYEKKIPLITSHRGEMWYFPEHTKLAYEYAFYSKADFVDSDLNPTSDGQLIIYHDPMLHPKYLHGLTPENGFRLEDRNQYEYTNNISGESYPKNYGWFVKDYSMVELSKLRTKVRYGAGTGDGYRPPYFDSKVPLQTINQAIDDFSYLNKKWPEVNRIGLNIELKLAVQYKTDFGIDVAKMLRDVLKERNLDTRIKAAEDVPVIIQNFDEQVLEYFKQQNSPNEALPTTLLVQFPIRPHQKDYTAKTFKDLGYIDIVSPDWRYFQNKVRNPEEYELNKNTLNSYGFMINGTFAENFHEQGILIHPYTQKDDFLQYSDTPLDEHFYYFEELKLDGIFSQNSRTAVLADAYFKKMNMKLINVREEL